MLHTCLKMNVTFLALCLLARPAAANPNDPIRVADYKGPVHVACIGDSITAGVGAGRGASYPAKLGKLLGTKWEVRGFGVSGTKTS